MSDLDLDIIELLARMDQIDPYNTRKSAIQRIISRVLVKVINKLSFQLGHPKDDLVFIIKEMIRRGEL